MCRQDDGRAAGSYARYQVPEIALVGGSSAFYRAAEVIEDYTGIPTWVPPHPALVTPIGMAMNNNPEDYG